MSQFLRQRHPEALASNNYDIPHANTMPGRGDVYSPEDGGPGVPTRKRTQKEQDEEDDAARKKAMKDLVQSWMDRLQLISVITTFFASTEAGLLSLATPDIEEKNSMGSIQRAASATLLGALIMHVFAAIVSFMASFLLIRYKLQEATREEINAEIGGAGFPNGNRNRNPNVHNGALTHSPINTEPDTGKADFEHRDSGFSTHSRSSKHKNPPVRVSSSASTREPPIWSSDPHLVQVSPFRAGPPAHLLSRCHTLCVFVSAAGFALALAGIVCLAWARLPRDVSVFGSAAMGGCFLAGVVFLSADF